MKIFIDTNVILENFLQRENYNVTHRLFDLLKKQEHVLIIMYPRIESMSSGEKI